MASVIYEKSTAASTYLKTITPSRIQRHASPDQTESSIKNQVSLSPIPVSKASKLLTQPQTRVFPLSVSPQLLVKKTSRLLQEEKPIEFDLPPFLQGFIGGVRQPKKRIKSVVGASFRAFANRLQQKPAQETSTQNSPQSFVENSFDIPKISYSYFKEKHQGNILQVERTATPEPRLYKRRVIKVNSRSKLTIYSAKEIPKIKPRKSYQSYKDLIPLKVIDTPTEVVPRAETPNKFVYNYKEPAWTLGEKIKRVKQISIFEEKL